jgi:CTP synthase
LSKLSSVTTGRIYSEVLEKERKGTFLGRTIQIIPHITDAIQNKITEAAKSSGCDIMMIEIGGTVGDIEGLPYLESIRQLRYKLGSENTLFVHCTLLPYLGGSKELKTKPTQASVRELRSIGIQPDFILARADYHIEKELLRKISLFCDVQEEYVIPAPTLKSIYEVPLNFQKNNIVQLIANRLNLGKLKPNLKEWEDLEKKINAKRTPLNIAIVGKYTGLDDAYLSVIESLKIAGYHTGTDTKIMWVSSEKLEEDDKETWANLRTADGILVPGGFGKRGIEGKIMAAKYARENKIPYLGLCLGMQIMSIEFARLALKDNQITSEEFDEDGKLDASKYAIHFLPGQHKDRDKGGTLRLGKYPCTVIKGTKTYDLYKTTDIEERHRHRYEFNNEFKDKLEEAGMVFSGIYEKGNLVEIAELKDHPFMMGCQFHPEFKSRPTKAHPLFRGFIEAAKKQNA